MFFSYNLACLTAAIMLKLTIAAKLLGMLSVQPDLLALNYNFEYVIYRPLIACAN